MANSYPANGTVILDDLKVCSSARLQPHFVSTAEHMFLTLESAHLSSYLPVVSFARAGCTLGAIGLERASNSDSLGNYTESEMLVGTRANTPTSIQTSGVRRIVVSSDGNVGIGTASPGAQFTVQGTGPGSGLQDGQVQIRTTTAANPSAIGFINSGNTPSFNDLAWIRAIITVGNARGSLSFVTRNSDGSNSDVAERMRITNEGSVGIGTSSPLARIHVEQSTSGEVGRFRANVAGCADLVLVNNAQTWGLRVDNAASNALHIRNFQNTTNIMTFATGGSVGIGTSSPSSRLDVSGADGRIQSRVDSSDGSTINVRPNAGKCGWISYTEDAVADRWGIGVKNGDAKLYFASGNVGSGGGTTRMVIDGDGNLSIGSSSTLSNVKLQICDANALGTDDMVRLMQCIPGNHAFYRSQRCGGATMIMGPTRNSNDGCIPSDSAIIWTTGNNPLVIGTCGRERMRFATSGNAVLGGTSSNIVGFTGTVLTVNGGGNYQGYEVSTSNVTRMTMVSDGINGYMSTRVAGMCLIFETGAASEKMRIGSDGRVGIGTSSASYLLHVNGTFYAAGSSIDYKEGICQYNTDSCLFMCLKPVTYQYKDKFKHLGKELKSETQIGLIAEDVAESYPELAILVNEEDNKVVRNVDYEKLSIILLSEVQKLRKEMDKLKK